MARILTLDEAIEADIFWHEAFAVYSPEYGRITGITGNSVRIERLGYSGWAFEDARDYESSWRCWDSKPTKEEQKTPWREE